MIYVHHTHFRNQVAFSIQIVPTLLCPVPLFSGKLAVNSTQCALLMWRNRGIRHPCAPSERPRCVSCSPHLTWKPHRPPKEAALMCKELIPIPLSPCWCCPPLQLCEDLGQQAKVKRPSVSSYIWLGSRGRKGWVLGLQSLPVVPPASRTVASKKTMNCVHPRLPSGQFS